MRSIFEYNDFRKYLKEYYEYKKKSTGYFTYRYFAQIAGFSSPVFIKLVIDGKSNLSDKSAEKLCRAMEFGKNESEYFNYLVLFQQEKDPQRKTEYLEILRKINKEFGVQVLDGDQYDYYETWYNSVLREIAPNLDPDQVEKEIGDKIFPSIGLRDAKKSLKMLLEKGLLIKDDHGAFHQSRRLISTGSEVESLAVRSLHAQMAQLGAESINTVPREERDISGLTMGVSEDAYKKIVDELADVRRRIIKIVAEDDVVDRVYRLNLQLFPLSKHLKKRGADSDE